MNLLNKVAIWLLSPLGTAFCLAGLALLLAWRRRLRSSKVLGALALIWLWLWTMPVMSHWLANQIGNQFPQVPIASVAPAQAMVVLGGAVSPPMIGQTEIDLKSAADRVWYAARLFHAGKAPLVLLSGGGDLERQAFSEARAMAVFLQDLGVPAYAPRLGPIHRARPASYPRTH